MIYPHETLIEGKWIIEDNRAKADATVDRIEVLLVGHLIKLTSASTGKEELYLDPADGRLWQLAFSREEMPGGAPRLEVLSPERAQELYDFAI